MYLCKTFMTFSMLTLLTFPLLAKTPELGKYPKAYSSGDYKVTLLRIGKAEENTVLIKVDGIDNEFDGEIYKHIKKCDTTDCNSFKYETTEIPGKKRWWTIQQSSQWGYGNLKFFPPGIDKEHYLSTEKRPKDFNPEKFYNEYQGQIKKRK